MTQAAEAGLGTVRERLHRGSEGGIEGIAAFQQLKFVSEQ